MDTNADISPPISYADDRGVQRAPPLLLFTLTKSRANKPGKMSLAENCPLLSINWQPRLRSARSSALDNRPHALSTSGAKMLA